MESYNLFDFPLYRLGHLIRNPTKLVDFPHIKRFFKCQTVQNNDNSDWAAITWWWIYTWDLTYVGIS